MKKLRIAVLSFCLVVCVLITIAFAGDIMQAGADNTSNTMEGWVQYCRLMVFDGTYWDRLLSTSGSMHVRPDSNIVDDAAFTPASASVDMIGAEFDDTAPDSVNEGDGGAVRMSANRNMYITVRDAAGNERGVNVTASNEMNVLESNSSAIKTAVEIMDDWDETDRAAVNLIASQAGITGGAGAVAANTPRVTLASDDPAVVDLAAIEVLQTSIEGDTSAIQSAAEIMDDWDSVHDSAVGTDGPMSIFESKDFDGSALPNNVGTEGDAVRGAASLYGVQYVMVVDEDGDDQPAYTSGTDSFRSEEIDPISAHHAESTPAEVTNGTDGTYYYYIDMDGYTKLGSQFTLSGGSGTVTVTMECSIQDDGTAQASCTYIDVTSDLWGVASITASDIWLDDAGVLGMCKYVRYKVVAATGAANDADWTIYAKKLY